MDENMKIYLSNISAQRSVAVNSVKTVKACIFVKSVTISVTVYRCKLQFSCSVWTTVCTYFIKINSGFIQTKLLCT